MAVPRKFPSSSGAIVYLTQGARHSSYGQSTHAQLHKSVQLLYENYNRAQRDDVVFLHTGDVQPDAQRSVLQLCGPEARFVTLAKHHFQLPADVDPKSKAWLWPNKFSAGYRHMVRFFTVGIWEVAESLGYAFVMRFDDDAYLLSPIPYNIFTFMAARKIEYGFRLTSWESGDPAPKGQFHAFVRTFAIDRKISPRWGLSQACPDGRIDRFMADRCGQLYTIYNNFFVANVSFWRSPAVQDFVRHVDASRTIYNNRWGDALWHSVALQLFMPREQLWMFDDFAYEHTSRKIYLYRGRPVVCFQWGGVALPATVVPSAAAMGRARALAGINMCQRARGDLNRCFLTREGDQRLLGVFAGTVTPEPPEVLASFCLRLKAERFAQPHAFCTGATGGRTASRATASRAYQGYRCAPRRTVLNTSVHALFAVNDSRTLRAFPSVVDGQLSQAVKGWSGGSESSTRLASSVAPVPGRPAERE